MPQPLDEQAAENLRAWADRERTQNPELADLLERFAVEGLPGPEDGTPWEEIRDRHYEALGIPVASWHVA